MRWPGRIAAGKDCHEVCGTIDLLPTFAELAGAPLPRRKIDGKSIVTLMRGLDGAQSPHEAFYYYDGGHRLMAVRSGKWKLMFAHGYNSPVPGTAGKPGQRVGKQIGLSLFDLEADVGESNNRAAEFPKVVGSPAGIRRANAKGLGARKKRRTGTSIAGPLEQCSKGCSGDLQLPRAAGRRLKPPIHQMSLDQFDLRYNGALESVSWHEARARGRHFFPCLRTFVKGRKSLLRGRKTDT